MLASNLTTKEMRKESRRLIKNLSRRIARIEGLGSTAPQYAVNKYRELEKKIPKRLTQLSDTDLRTLYRDLKSINSLKSSTVKGAMSTQSKLDELTEKMQVDGKYSTLRELFSSLSPKTRDSLWEFYGKTYDTMGKGIADKFKYELFGTAIDYVYGGEDIERAVLEIDALYERVNRELGSNADDETIKVLFTKRLQTLFK